jgi:mercuric ion transport protein
MIKDKSASLGLFSSLAASLCCITPLVAALGGVSGVASAFSWIEPARPYLVGSAVVLLGLAWFQKLRPKKGDDCGCEVPEKQGITQSTGFLAMVTVLAALLMAFPLYAHLFYTEKKPVDIAAVSPATPSKKVAFTVKGMSCASCEPEVETAVSKLSGIQDVKASCLKKTTVVQFDPTKTSVEAIREAINSTGYTVENQNHE